MAKTTRKKAVKKTVKVDVSPVKVYDQRGRYVREYTLELHGVGYRTLAGNFCKKKSFNIK